MAKKPAKPKAEASEDDAILKEAKERFGRCESWEAHARANGMEDDKFVNADSDNKWQWPDKIAQTREIDARPVLTINKVRQHCLMIENDAKQNKAAITVHPTADDVSYDAAQVFSDIIRHIEAQSHAQNAYDKATEKQVRIGYGVIRIITDYCDPDTFDQEIYIRGVLDPNSVYFDPDAKEPDKSDSRFAFVFDDMSKDKFKADYPGHDDLVIPSPSIDYGGWLGDNHIRVAEYWRVETRRDTLASWVNPETKERVTLRKSNSDPALWKSVKADEDPTYKEREVAEKFLQCFTIAGDKIIDRKEWAGIYIPLVPVIGEEVVVDGQMDRRGHVRMMKDPQRIYNYYSSGAVEVSALQSKAPYIGPAAAFEGLEQYWANANTENLAYIPYNHLDDRGQPVPPPQRQAPPTGSDAMTRGLEIAQNEMMMASGQYQAQMGENENAKSGKAIAERQRQGDNATYHFIDNLAIALRHVGRILVDLIPRIYDTKRVLLVRGLDGAQRRITIDPDQTQALVQQEKNEQNAALIFNPNVGKYDVEADVGPSYSTRRQEAWNAITQILTTRPELTSVIGDLLFKNADFPSADEIAERLRKTMNPSLFGDGPTPQDQQMMAQVQHMQALIGDLMTKLTEAKMQLKGKDAQKDVDVYDAETRRITAISNAQPELGIDAIRPVVAQTLAEMLGFNLSPVTNAMAPTLAQDAGAQQQEPQNAAG